MTEYYFDYNSTSPLAPSVIDRLRQGEVEFFNPSASHSLARESQKMINETSRFILKTFDCDETHDAFYHSGTTEGINTIFHSFSKIMNQPLFIAFETDHSCVINTIKALVGDQLWLKPLASGDVNIQELEQVLELNKNRNILMNWTWSHNETGIVWPLTLLSELKKKYSFHVHVDAAQIVGKYFEWKSIPNEIDYLTFSGHKFGALKGIGFTLFKAGSKIMPLIHGGGQQRDYRSGTMNTLGIISLRDALSDELALISKMSEIEKYKKQIEYKIVDMLIGHGEIVGKSASFRNNNTLFIVIDQLSSDRSFPYFDIEDVVVGTGAACASGAKKANRTLQVLGYDKRSSHGLRLSFSPRELLYHHQKFENKILEILKKIING